jgi:hypothetical protein
MAEIIQLREFQLARERAQRHFSEQQNLERAVAIMRENLAVVAERLKTAHIDEQPELLDRVESLAAIIRYAIRMLGEAAQNSAAHDSPRG